MKRKSRIPTDEQVQAYQRALRMPHPRVPAWVRELAERDKSTAGQPQVGDKSNTTPLEIALLLKRRVRLNQWQRDYAKAMGWPLRGRGRPKKKRD
jgi:hypothetical protein